MSNTPKHQETLSSKDSMPNKYVDENSATEKPVTDQDDPSTTPDACNPVASIGAAVGAVAGEFIITETTKVTEFGHQKFERQYRRAGSDALVKVEQLFDGSVVRVDFGPGATDEDLAVDQSDTFKVRMAKVHELLSRDEDEYESVGPESWWPKNFGNVITDEAVAREIFAYYEKDQFAPGLSEREKALIGESRHVWLNVEIGLRTRIEKEGAERKAEAEARKRDEKFSAARLERDIVKRAKALETEIQFKDVKKVRMGDMVIPQPQMTDENKLCVLNALFADEQEKPHRDHYRGRIVDHEGNIIDDHYPVVRWVQAFSATGLKGVSLRAAREAVKEYALCHERNDLIDRVNRHIPQWDGQSRMKKKLIDLFELRDTPLTQNVGQYFWLSLYNRVMVPGSLAPIAIALIGAQGCGKSLFAKKLCQIITGDNEADSVQLNLDGDWMEFLRAITGNSVIATVGEMAGFTRADTNKIKDVTTRVADQMHYKFEGTFTQQRQWIMMLDGNKYELQRDETGNRRFMPLFCGQLEDVGGQPRWRQDFEAIFDDKERGICFEDDVWQIMAECAEWMNDNGESGYGAFVREVVRQVLEFNKGEMAAERGIVVDGDIETYLDLALSKVKLETVQMRDGSGSTCVRVDRVELLDVIHGLSNGKAKIHPNGLRKAMAARGADEVKPSGVPKYRFAKLADQAAFDKRLAERNPSMDDEATKVQDDRF
ncbi:VapE domain-containing protein [Burkholderia diffusa]|uniref:VapE domain-containing protein n=1 Tax=Burkholderia diffusa TaxID=488732 RepID=UPI002ABD4048|nr:VapE domain-containing protein [Burkholderia diffusa]